MKTIEKIDPEIIEHYEDMDYAPRGLHASKIYEKLEKTDENEWRMSKTEVEIAEALENAMTAYVSISHQFDSGNLLTMYETNGDPDDQDQFVRSYAMYAACSKALHQLEAPRENGSMDTTTGAILRYDEETLDSLYSKQRTKNVGPEDLEQGGKSDRLSRGNLAIQTFIKEYSNVLDEVSGHDALVPTTVDYLNSVARDCYHVMESHPEYFEIVQDINLEINGFVLSGLESQGIARGLTTKQIDWDEIVGNDDLKIEVRSALWNIMDYDQEAGNQTASIIGSPHDFIIGYGEPGTGKSMAMAAAATEMRQLSEELGKDIVIEELGGEVKDMYHGGTSENIRQKFDTVTDPSTIGLLLADDIESLFPSREEMEGEVEDKDGFRELLNQIQGFLSSEDRNNYLILGATNHPHLLDKALYDRGHLVEAQGPQTRDEYSDIFEIHLNHIDERLREVNDYTAIGEEAHKYDMSGRDVERVTSSLSSRGVMQEIIHNVGHSYFQMEPEEKEAILLERSQTVTEDNVLDAIDDLMTTQQNQEEEAKKERIRRMAERLAIEELAEEQVDDIKDEYQELFEE